MVFAHHNFCCKQNLYVVGCFVFYRVTLAASGIGLLVVLTTIVGFIPSGWYVSTNTLRITTNLQYLIYKILCW